MSFSNRRIILVFIYFVSFVCVGAEVFTTVLDVSTFMRFREENDKILLFSSRQECAPCDGFHSMWRAIENVLSQLDVFTELKLAILHLKDGDTLQPEHWSIIEQFPSVHFLEFGEPYKYRGELEVRPIIGFLQEMMSDTFTTINDESELVNLSQYVLQIGGRLTRAFRTVARKRSGEVPHYFLSKVGGDPHVVVVGVASPDARIELNIRDVTTTSLLKHVIHPWTYCGPEHVRDITSLDEDILWVLLKGKNIRDASENIKPLILRTIEILALQEIFVRFVYPDLEARQILSRALYSPVPTSLIFMKRIGDITLRFVYDEERNGVADPDGIVDFVTNASASKLEPTWRSEDIPTHHNSLIKIITSKNFEESVFNDISHVILISSTENCSFGLALQSTINELSKLVSTNTNFTNDVRMLRLNLFKNEIDPRIMKFDKCFSVRLIRILERTFLDIDITPSMSAGSVLESIMNYINAHHEL